MKKALLILVSFVAVLVFGWFIYRETTFKPQRPVPPVSDEVQPTPTKTPQPTITGERPKPDDQAQVSDQWTKLYDGALSFQTIYPASFSARPATNKQGESAFYSFNPKNQLGAGPVPKNEIKIAVVYFSKNDSREVSYEESEIVSQTQTTVDGYSATRRKLSGAAGSSIVTSVGIGNEQYIISAYPADSKYINTYNQFLGLINLGVNSPIKISKPSLGQEISSPLEISGQAPGSWFFEANLSLKLVNDANEILAEKNYMTSKNWMTQEMISFETQLEFGNPEANAGYLRIDKANPSGRPQNANQFFWPITF